MGGIVMSIVNARTRHFSRFLLFPLFFVAAVARPAVAVAQPHLFVGGDLFADVKRFSGEPTTNTLDGTGIGAGAETGVALTDHWSVLIAVDGGRSTTTTRSIPIGVLAAPVGVTTPITAFSSQVSNRITATSVLAGYRISGRRRLAVEVLGGLSFLHVRRDFTTIRTPPVAAAPALVIRPYTLLDNVAAASVDGDFVIGLTSHLAVVPRARVHAFSLSSGGPSGFVIRPGIAARWTF
jgi:hypothetical protein